MVTHALLGRYPTGVGVTGVDGHVTGVEARVEVGAGDTEVVHLVQCLMDTDSADCRPTSD